MYLGRVGGRTEVQVTAGVSDGRGTTTRLRQKGHPHLGIYNDNGILSGAPPSTNTIW